MIRQLERMLPALRTQGMSQVSENNRHDFLLRLGQHLQDGGIVRWTEQLVPWLAASRQRVPLRGLMFSLPEKKTAGTSASTADAEQYIPGSQRHALTLPAIWQGTVDGHPCCPCSSSATGHLRKINTDQISATSAGMAPR